MKRKLLDSDTFLCNWILDFLLGNAISTLHWPLHWPLAYLRCVNCPSCCWFTLLLNISHEQQLQKISIQRGGNGAAWKLFIKKTLSLNAILDKNGVCFNTTKSPWSISMSFTYWIEKPPYSQHTHTIQRNQKQHPEQLHHGLAWELHHLRLQGSTAEHENNRDPHQALSLSHY